MSRLTEEQKKELEKEVQTDAFKEGKISTQSIATKYGLSWKRAKDAVKSAEKRLEHYEQLKNIKPIPEETITVEQLEKKEKELETPREKEERYEFQKKQRDDKPKISLIPEKEEKKSLALDSNKFYCGTCLKSGNRVELQVGATNCPKCRGVLIWEN